MKIVNALNFAKYVIKIVVIIIIIIIITIIIIIIIIIIITRGCTNSLTRPFPFFIVSNCYLSI